MEVIERHFFSKSERLCLKNSIDCLFSNGLSFIAYPLRVLFLPKSTDLQPGVDVLISVPKKRFKRAVHRNRIKRLIREVYRLNSNELKSSVSQKAKRLQIAFMYVSNDLPAYKDVETGIKKAMKMLEQKMVE
jgi:ribonuclease P protein component